MVHSGADAVKQGAEEQTHLAKQGCVCSLVLFCSGREVRVVVVVVVRMRMRV